MKKLVILSVMLLVSITCLGQNNNLPDVLSVKDAIAIYNGGMEVAKSKLAKLGYKNYGECGIYNCWIKNCEFSCDLNRPTKFGKGTSSVVYVDIFDKTKTRTQISVYNKAAFQKLKSQIVALGYKKINESEGSGTDLYETYSKDGTHIITAADESCGGRMSTRQENYMYFYIEVSKE